MYLVLKHLRGAVIEGSLSCVAHDHARRLHTPALRMGAKHAAEGHSDALMDNTCSTDSCQAVQDQRKVDQACGASAVVMAHRGNAWQLLPSKRRMAAIDDTISGVGLHDME